jgi:hypothetical protein
MKFGLVEHSMINIETFSAVGEAFSAGRIRDRRVWETTFDDAHVRATALTFGNLVRRVAAITEFHNLESDLKVLKVRRDYFAHRFMRDEASLMTSDDGCWLLLDRMADLRQQTLAIEDALRPRFQSMCKRLGLPLPEVTQQEAMIEEIEKNTSDLLAGGRAKVGWE